MNKIFQAWRKLFALILPLFFAAVFYGCGGIFAPHSQLANIAQEPVWLHNGYHFSSEFSPHARFNPRIDLEQIAKLYAAQSPLERILFHTEKWRATPYRLGGNSAAKGADCSAFTQQLFMQAFGISLARSTTYQRRQGHKISPKNLRAGDILFFRTNGPNGLHVGIYLENNDFVHLSEHGGARKQNLRMNYWQKRFLEARRYIKEPR